MRNLVILIAIAILLYLLVKWFTKTPSKHVIISLRKYAIYGIGAILILLVVTGRMHWLYGVIAGLLPLGQRLFTAWRTINYFRRFTTNRQNTNNYKNSASSNQSSSIETSFLNMSLDHDTGEMTGIVKKGKFINQKLNQLTLDQLLELLTECYTLNDNDSTAVLESYLDRYHGTMDGTMNETIDSTSDAKNDAKNANNWRDQYHYHSSNNTQTVPDNSAMTIKEAYLILGLTENVGKKEIKDAHRRLMQKFHPDRGGSTYLSAKINQAKDFLLSDKKH